MSKRSSRGRWGVLASAAVLAALAGCLMHSPSGHTPCVMRAAPPAEACEPEKPLTEMAGFGVRPGALLSKTGFTADDLPYLRHFRAAVGVRPEDVEAFAVVYFDDSASRVLLVRTKGDVPQGGVMMACQAVNLTKMACGSKVYTGESGLAVHFLEPRVAVIADSVATMGRSLARVPALMARLDEAGEHDLTAWACKPADGRFPGFPPEEADLVAKVEKGRVRADVELTFDAGVELYFADEESARVGKELLAGGADVSGGSVGIALGYLRILKARPELLGQDADVKGLLDLVPVDLLVRTEKALHKTRADVKGKTASATFRVPLKLGDRPACQKLFDHTFARKVFDEKWTPGLVFDAKGGRSAADESDLGTLSSYELPTSDRVSTPTPPDAGPAPLPAITEKATLAVANVRKEDVLLFTTDKGELTFADKLPHGEALDLDTTKGQRWVAVFTSYPYRESFTVKESKAVWLIRPTPPPPPPSAPVENFRSWGGR